MIQRRQHLRFALEPRHAFGVTGERLRQDFQSDVAAKLGVARAVNLAHAAGANRRKDLVGAEPLLRFQAHLSKACQLVTSTSGASAPGSRMARTRKRLPSG